MLQSCTEFYKFFWSDLKRMIFENVQHAFQAEILCLGQRPALLTLLLKSRKDFPFLDNCCPLSLLNTATLTREIFLIK